MSIPEDAATPYEHKHVQFNYAREINPLVTKLCEMDTGNDNATRGQVQEFLKNLCTLIRQDGINNETATALKRYANTL